MICVECGGTGEVLCCPYCYGPERDYHTSCLKDESIICELCRGAGEVDE